MAASTLTKPNGPTNSDAAVGAALVTADPTIGTGEPVEVLGDSAYASDDMLNTLAGKGWLPLVKPWPLRPAVEGGFTLDDFVSDATAGTLTCSGNITRRLSAKGHATFGAAYRGCPLRQRCTTCCSDSTAGAPVTRTLSQCTASTGRWWNARST